MDIDPLSSLAPIEARISATADPEERAILESVRDRVIGEMIGDVDRILRHVAPNFELRMHPAAPEMPAIDSKQAFAGMLSAMGDAMKNGLLWMQWENFLVDNGCFSANGTMHVLQPGAMAKARYPDAVDDPDATYLVTTPVGVFSRHEGGLQVNEEAYMDPAGTKVVKFDGDFQQVRKDVLARLGEG